MQTANWWAVAAALAALAAHARAVEIRYYYDVTVTLEGAVFLPDDPESPKDLELYLGVRDGRWDGHVMGWAGGTFDAGQWVRTRAVMAMDHEGRILEVQDPGDAVRMTVEMTLHDDPWVKGGPGRYTLDLARKGRRYEGAFSGTYRGKAVSGKAVGEQRACLWPSPVEGVEPFGPGEHPRLVFRRGDLAALRERAGTPDGRAMIARLKDLLGGEDGPALINKATQAYGGGSGNLPVGEGYTLWHGMGFGFLYQLTGQTRYADLARQCVDQARRGVRDRDQRYSWHNPGGKLRAGSSFAAIAQAYDFCYDAWDPAYRQTVAREIQEKVFRSGPVDPSLKALAEPVDTDLVFQTGGGQHSPYSNHYMAWNGGGGTAILGVWGDPNTDDDVCRRAYRVFLQRGKRALLASYGERGYFYEGHHCGRLNTNTGFSSFIQALRVGLGQDLVSNYESGRWLLTKWIYEIVRWEGTLHNLQRGMYAGPTFPRTGMSSGGDFGQSFGIAPAEHKPAILWFYNHVICPGPAKDWDALVWPHRGVYAFVNWPLGVKERNPAEVLPKAVWDAEADYYMLRSGWSGGPDDVVATIYRGAGQAFGMGLRRTFSGIAGPQIYSKYENGTYVASTAGGSLALDASGASGAPFLVAVYHGPCGSGARPERPADTGGDPAVAAFVARLKADFATKTAAPRTPGIAETAEAPPEKPKPGKADRDPDAEVQDAASPAAGEAPRARGQPATRMFRATLGTYDLAVLLYYRGASPPVSVGTRGERNVLEVGGRAVWFDGTKIVLDK
jgi:hypothetical protein